MAHLKRANAMVVHPRISGRGWGGICKLASNLPKRNLTDQAREILGGNLDPNKYLFTHCTIVASVDTDKVPDVSLGKSKVGSVIVDRRYDDYYIKPESSQFVNNNGDSWSRQVLLAAYPTFIGAHNFQEHVQIEDQSKGRIIDAVARDIGDSVYIDILVATDRKHASLVQDIESGKLATLSMGCTTDFTICSQCGHYAVDETALCEHIRYGKLNTFMDEQGKKRVVAELCGHATFNGNPKAPGGVRFIEASWVAVPAFPGAVMRNILKTSDAKIPESEIRKILFSNFSPNWSDTAVNKAASLNFPKVDQTRKLSFDFGEESPAEAPAEAPAEGGAQPEKTKPFEDIEKSVYDMISNRVRERFEKDLKGNEAPEESNKVSTWPNDTLNKESSKKVRAGEYKASLSVLAKTASSRKSLVEGVATIDKAYGFQNPPVLYKIALGVGSTHRYSNPKAYAQSCHKAAGKELSFAEFRVIVRVGTLLSAWESRKDPSRSR